MIRKYVNRIKSQKLVGKWSSFGRNKQIFGVIDKKYDGRR